MNVYSLIQNTEDDLTPSDLAYLRAFALKTDEHLSLKTFAKLPGAFPESDIPGWQACQSCVVVLSGFKPEVYDCCINSCCCFVGPLATLSHCSYCNEPHFNAKGRPCHTFIYLPLIPCLQSFLSNATMAEKMQYRATAHVHEPGKFTDIMDGHSYRCLLDQKVTVDGRILNHKFFEDCRDVALGLTSDSFGPFRWRNKTAWPLIIFNYNLPSETHFHLDNILSLDVIPGPKKLHDFDSFLWPLVQELLHLEIGIHAFDTMSKEYFALRAYLVLIFGDIPAVAMLMKMKGHNGFSPCRMCSIKGIQVPNSHQQTLYVSLDRSCHPEVARADGSIIQAYDPTNLPLRTHEDFLRQAREVSAATTEAQSEYLA